MRAKLRMNGGGKERKHLNPLHELACFILRLINNLDVMGNLLLSPCSYKFFGQKLHMWSTQEIQHT